MPSMGRSRSTNAFMPPRHSRLASISDSRSWLEGMTTSRSLSVYRGGGSAQPPSCNLQHAHKVREGGLIYKFLQHVL